MKIYYFSGHGVSFHCFANTLEEAVKLSVSMQKWFIEILEVIEISIPETPQLVGEAKPVTGEFRSLYHGLSHRGVMINVKQVASVVSFEDLVKNSGKSDFKWERGGAVDLSEIVSIGVYCRSTRISQACFSIRFKSSERQEIEYFDGGVLSTLQQELTTAWLNYHHYKGENNE